jgi:hypothetical protein
MTSTAKQGTIAAMSKSLKGKTVNLTVDENTKVLYCFAMGRDVGVASVNEYKGREALDIRRFYYNADEDTFAPTGKGIRIPVMEVPQLLDALAAAKKDGTFDGGD